MAAPCSKMSAHFVVCKCLPFSKRGRRFWSFRKQVFSEVSSSVREYLWLIAHVTAAAPDGNGHWVGIVEDGEPVPTSRIAAGLKRSREATLANLEKVEDGNYISRSAAAGHAYDYRVRILLKGSRAEGA